MCNNCGTYHTLVLISDGRVYIWGGNSWGQIGCGDNPENICTPIKLQFNDNVKIESIYCCYDSSFAITSDGHVFSWGDNRGHELGLNITDNRFIELSTAGEGAFGSVFKVRHKLDDNLYAVKKVQFLDKMEEKEMMREVTNLRKLDSDFVVKYENSWTEGKQLYIQMEYCPQTLGSVLRDKRQVFGRQSTKPMNIYEYFICCEIFRELLICVRYLHDQDPQFIHRDLKPDNILISYTSVNNTFVKLGDFGLATEHARSFKSHTQGAGTPDYMAPEVHLYKNYNIKADIYSVGGIGMKLFEINPSDCQNYNSKTLWKQFNRLHDLITSMIEIKVNKRPTSCQVLDAYTEWSLDKQIITANEQQFNETLNNLKSNDNSFFYECLLYKTESTDRVTKSLSADTQRCDLLLNNIGERVANEEDRVQRLDPLTTTFNTDDIGAELTQVEQLLNNMRVDVQTLRKCGYSTVTVGELHDKVQQLCQRWADSKDKFWRRVMARLEAKRADARRRSPTAKQALIDKYPEY
ncbi:unnamed protein product [Medioppia subpectinata]|uniref:Protein kinase domain-containing protein n=1 Tax=Medioppia subpectinata TaxID=1979941 RepID=A0A7R9PVJ6_9ACAR|nr:unnamed protein product [Medioppia subpectinata]CAG2102353.1 unnamed protein product [Medioppia subpectinata]